MNLPHDENAEKLILGAVFLNNFLINQVAALIEPDDFYSQVNRNAFIGMVQLSEGAVEINPITLNNQLKKETGTDQTIYYSSLVQPAIGFASGVAHTAHVLREKANLRRLIRLAAEIEAQANDNEDPSSVADHIEQSLSEIRKRVGGSAMTFRSFEEIDVDAGEAIERLHRGDSSAVPTGYKSLDRATRGGNQPGDVWVVASLTGRGKSSWALGAARMQAVAGIPVAFVSREMSELENYCRVLSASSGVPMWRIKPGMYPDTYYSLQEWRSFTSTLPILMNCGSQNIFEVRGRVKEMVRTKGIKSLFVDYLQLLKLAPDTKASNRANEVATVSRVLKEMAMENQIAVFALAQFNRYAAHGERPEIHHLAESSGIEKDASVVLILDMPEQKDKESDRECEMRIAKHRNGPCLSLKYRYRGDVLTFEEAA